MEKKVNVHVNTWGCFAFVLTWGCFAFVLALLILLNFGRILNIIEQAVACPCK